MRPIRLTVIVTALTLAGAPAFAETGAGLFGSAAGVPANPFASNYPSPQAGAAAAQTERPRRAQRRRQGRTPRPPRDSPR